MKYEPIFADHDIPANLKESQYNVVTESFSEGRYIAYNSFTGSYFEMGEDRFAEMDALTAAVAETGCPPKSLTLFQKELVTSGFFVPPDMDELAEVHARYTDPMPDIKGMSLTIAPTISCNFGCGYCFQSHSKRRMGQDEMDRMVAFVEDQLEPDSYLAIVWFGGEPTTAFHVVEQLAKRLSELAASRNCSFSHSIITNGYLLTEERARFLSSIPEFEMAQITLDGLPDLHDARRPTLKGKGTFDRIVENVAVASQFLPISIRVNVDKSNINSLTPLLELLAARVVQHNVFIYLGHVWDYTPEVEESPFLTIEEFAAVESQFKLTKLSFGFSPGMNLPQPRTGPICVADHPNGFVVGPSGLLFNCWNEVHEDESKASGVLPDLGQSGGCGSKGNCGSAKMTSNQAGWDAYDPFAHTPCRTCKVAPLCMSGCPWESNKTGSDEPGFCTALRFNLPDELRLYELGRKMRASKDQEAAAVPVLSN